MLFSVNYTETAKAFSHGYLQNMMNMKFVTN